MHKLVQGYQTLKKDVSNFFTRDSNSQSRESSQKFSDRSVRNRIIKTDCTHQPKTHQDQKPFYEKMFLCFPNKDFNSQELNIYTEYQNDYNVQFDNENPKHISFLLKLYSLIFQSEIKQIEDPRWQDIGFQGDNPSTDFRAAGLQGLFDMLYFCEQLDFNQKNIIFDQDQNYNFLFAIISINITFFIKQFFHLSHNIDIVQNKNSLCSRALLKKMMKILQYDRLFFQKFHTMILLTIFNSWIKYNVDTKEKTVFQMEPIKNQMLGLAKKTIEKASFQNFEQFELKFFEQIVKQKILEVDEFMVQL